MQSPFVNRQTFFRFLISASRVSLLAFAFLFLCGSTAFADGIVAALKNSSTVTRYDASSGIYLGAFSVDNAIAVGCDGTTIAVLCNNGNVRQYDAQSGSYQGSISTGQVATGVQVSGGIITVQCGTSLRRYDAKTGSYLGSESL